MAKWQAWQSYELFRITAMRVSNAKAKLRSALLLAFELGVLWFCLDQVYSAWLDGIVRSANRASHEWITYQGNPNWFVGSVVVYSLIVLLVIVALGAMVVGWRNDRQAILRNRSKPLFDNAIRLDPESR